MEKPSRGGKKRTAVWASHHEERGSDGAVSPPMCDHRVVLHRCVVREWCNPPGSTVATCLNAAARTLRAARAVQGDVLSVWQVLHGTPSAPPIPAQRVARFDDHCTRNCLLKNKLRQRYSRSKGGRYFYRAVLVVSPVDFYGCVNASLYLPEYRSCYYVRMCPFHPIFASRCRHEKSRPSPLPPSLCHVALVSRGALYTLPRLYSNLSPPSISARHRRVIPELSLKQESHRSQASCIIFSVSLEF